MAAKKLNKQAGKSRIGGLPFDSKIIIGVAVPLVIIVALVLLSGIGNGLTVDVQTVQSLERHSLFYDSYDYSIRPPYAPVQSITIKNTNFLPKKYELPKITACLKGTSTSLNTVYSPVEKASKIASVPIVSDIASARSSYYDYYGSYESLERVDVPSYGEKVVTLYVVPYGVYGLEEGSSMYNSVNTLLLIERKSDTSKYYYSPCEAPDADAEAKGAIPLVGFIGLGTLVRANTGEMPIAVDTNSIKTPDKNIIKTTLNLTIDELKTLGEQNRKKIQLVPVSNLTFGLTPGEFDPNPLGGYALKLVQGEPVTIASDEVFVYKWFTFQVRSINFNGINLIMSCGDSCGFSGGEGEGGVEVWEEYGFYYTVNHIDFENKKVTLTFYDYSI